MKYKISLAILLLVLMSSPIFSQEKKECKIVAEKTFQAIKNKSSEVLIPHLAENFIISGYKGDIAKQILEQLVSQLSLNSYEFQSTNIEKNKTKIAYTVDYKGTGNKQSVFTFNENCEFETLELFKMEVKVLSQGDTKIDMPKDNVIQIPFERVRNLIKVEASLNGEKRPFLFDSGSSRLELNSKYTAQNEQHNSISNTKGVTDKNVSGMDIKKISHLNFVGIQITNQKVVTTDLSHLENILGAKIYGLIGYEMFKDYDLCIDYNNQMLTLIKPDYFESYQQTNLKNAKIVSIPIKMKGHIPVLEVSIQGQKLNLGLDSGAESNLIDYKLFHNLENNLKNVKTSDIMGIDKNSVKTKSGILKTLDLNGKRFKNLKTVFSDIDHFNTKELNIQGLIGYPILSKQKTIISYKRGEVLFTD